MLPELRIRHASEHHRRSRPDSLSRTLFPHQPHGIVRSDHDVRRLLTSPNPLKQAESRRAVSMSQSRTDPEPQAPIR